MMDASDNGNAAMDYERQLTAQLEKLLGEMDGVGAVRVMITFSASGEEIPLKDVVRSDADTTETDSGAACGSSMRMPWKRRRFI